MVIPNTIVKYMKTIKSIAFTVSIIFIFSAFTTNEDPKLKKIFNGKDLQGWVAPENNIWWIVDEGMLTAKSDPEKQGLYEMKNNKFRLVNLVL